MALPTTPRGWYDALSWHVRGLFATEAMKRASFSVRGLWQPAEVEARKGLGRDLAIEIDPALRVDRARGYRVFADAALPRLDEVIAIGRSIVRNASLDVGVANADKKFSRIRLATRDERIALLRAALDRRVLAMAADYLGVFPVISEADYFCSFAVAGAWTKSQLWHCDEDAGDVFKLFIYCDDAAEADGPFELIDADTSARARDAIGYRYAGRRYRVADDVMAREVPASRVTTLLGPAGTAFACDTGRCFHRGSRIVDPAHRRVAATICYVPPAGARIPRRLARENAPLVAFADAFTGSLERAALGVPVARSWI